MLAGGEITLVFFFWGYFYIARREFGVEECLRWWGFYCINGAVIWRFTCIISS